MLPMNLLSLAQLKARSREAQRFITVQEQVCLQEKHWKERHIPPPEYQSWAGVSGDHGSESNVSAVPWVPAAAIQGTVCPPTWS